MKKLLLASDGGFLINEGYKLLGIATKDLNIGYVTTAKKGVTDWGYVNRHMQAMTAQGYAFEEIDIEGKTKRELSNFFDDKNVVQVEGGNTFYLLKAVKENNFGVILKELVDRGVWYVGTSAGAYLACPTIETSAWGPDVKDRYGVKDFTALNLVPFLLKVHYTDEMQKLVCRKAKSCSLPVRILRNGQGILVDGNTYRLVGEGEEVFCPA